LDNLTDKNGETDAKGAELGEADQLDNANRRRFSRNALVGSAVLLSLGNRSAWGGGGRSMGCMSLATINSFDPATGMFVSAPAGRPTRNEDLAAEIHRIADKPTWKGRDGTYSSCQDPDSIDSVCLIKGDCS
jgi:hypothetical protein